MSEQDKSDGEEKTLDPSPGRLEKARRDGDVAQSKETTAAFIYLTFFLSIVLAGSWMSLGFVSGFMGFLAEPHQISALIGAGDTLLVEAVIVKVAPYGLVLICGPALGVLLSVISQRSISVAPKKLAPKLSRISLLGGLKKKYGQEGLVEFLKSAVKLTVICALFTMVFLSQMHFLPLLSRQAAGLLPVEIHRQFVLFFGVIVLFSFAMAALDLPWAHYQHRKKLRMTREEWKKENKENEGDPALKQKRKERGRAIAENRMMLDVPKADIVLVNPTHYAVALHWDRKSGKAPICVAKGVDEVAARIKQAAALANVPIKSDPPTTRGIWSTVEIGEEIKSDHYKAVAAAIHFADRMRKIGTQQ